MNLSWISLRLTLAWESAFMFIMNSCKLHIASFIPVYLNSNSFYVLPVQKSSLNFFLFEIRGVSLFLMLCLVLFIKCLVSSWWSHNWIIHWLLQTHNFALQQHIYWKYQSVSSILSFAFMVFLSFYTKLVYKVLISLSMEQNKMKYTLKTLLRNCWNPCFML